MYPSEIRFAKYLENQGKSWVFQPPRFELKNTTYRTDFYCPEDNTYYEVVGTRQALSGNKEKLKEFINTYPNVKFKIVRPSGEDYYRKKQKKIKIRAGARRYFRSICSYCENECKQPKGVEVIYCPQFKMKESETSKNSREIDKYENPELLKENK